MNPFFDEVTLVVYGWAGSQPGTLAWVFPSYGAALSAVRALKNAARWIIVRGTNTDSRLHHKDVKRLRQRGLVLAEA